MSEYAQVVGTMIVFMAILIGSYQFVPYSPGWPGKNQGEWQAVRECEAD